MIAKSPFRPLKKIVCDDGTEVKILPLPLRTEDMIDWGTYGHLFSITVLLSPQDFKKLILDKDDA